MAKASKIDFSKFEGKTGETVQITESNIIRLENKGDSFIGKFTGIQHIDTGKNEFDTFLFETAEGKQSFAGGISLANTLKIINAGSIVRVTYDGQKKLGKGHKMNMYKVELLQGSINEKEKKRQLDEIMEKVAKKNKAIKKKGVKK